jgi:glycine/sarcosine/betaine reductase complex component C subunit beta
MTLPVIKASSYTLVHAPNILQKYGSTQIGEMKANPDSEFLKKLPDFLRSYKDVVGYAPNQAYIGNISIDEMKEVSQPWYNNAMENSSRYSNYGEIMPEDELIGLLKISDAFDLVKIEEAFATEIKEKLNANPVITENLTKKIVGENLKVIEDLVKKDVADPIYMKEKLVGCVKQAHGSDPSLNAHIMLENLAVKGTGLLSLLHILKQKNIKPEDIDYVIEVSEEACGDVNQRGGGNFAKSIAELAGCINATGSDTRSFCAAPAHGIINAAGLVASGIYENVLIVAGGSTAKLGMNSRDHVAKGLPVLEDCYGGFAVLVSKDDKINPIIKTNAIGKHTISTGASPQAVMSALVTTPLEKLGLKVTDIDKYSAELQNAEITKPAGAGDVPTANYKMIAALGVMKGHIEKKDMLKFVTKHGMPGFAPTQGHIPSGVPFIGHAHRDILSNKIKNTMVIGKGSLFLGRMTNLFDGMSFIIEKNSKVSSDKSVSEKKIKSIVAGAMRNLADSLLAEKM